MFISEKPHPKALLAAARHYLWSDTGVTESKNLRYGPLERHRVDIYEPNIVDEETKVVFFVHGGGWESGSKDLHRFIGRSWAGRDLVLVLPNYRLVPQTTYPGQLEDLVRCLAWFKEHYPQFSESFYLAGHSAGAHMASLIGWSDRWLREAHLSRKSLEGLILMAGVYQFYPYDQADPRIRKFVNDREKWEEAQPINHVGPSSPPVFMAHGENDSEVSTKQSTQLGHKLSELGVRNEVLLQENTGHLELLLETCRQEARLWSLMRDFFGTD